LRPFSAVRYEDAGKPKDGYVLPGTDKGRVPYSTIDSQHARALAALPDVSHFRLYDLRHTFLTRLGEVNTDPYTIQKIAGHSSIIMSQRYVHPTPERVEDALSRLQIYNHAMSDNAPSEGVAR
jgi:integrase